MEWTPADSEHSNEGLLIDGQPSWRSVVEGYAGAESYVEGDRVSVHCSSAVPTFSATVSRIGAEREVVWRRDGIPGMMRDVPDRANENGCSWPGTFEIPVEAGWASGYYEVHFAWDGSASLPDRGTYAYFVVRATELDPSRPLLVLATTTWQAYNEWGGSGLYRGATRVSIDRPYDRGFLHKRNDIPPVRVADVGEAADVHQRGLQRYLADSGYGSRAANAGWWEWERRFVAWVERNGYGLDLAVSSDLELRPEVVQGRRLVLSVGHDEYWSAGMRDTIEEFAGNGGNVAFFSGDICTSKIRFDPNARAWESYAMTGRVEDDPVWPDGDVTGWWMLPALARPETAMTGVSTVFGGYARFGRSTPRGPRGFLVQRPDHWIFDGVDVAWGDAFGAAGCLAGFELGGCRVRLEDNLFVATGEAGTPGDTEVLAVAPAHLWREGDSSDLFEDEGEWSDSVAMIARALHGDRASEEQIQTLSHGWATMVMHRPGGQVFAAATTEWAQALHDPAVAAVTRNILGRFLES